MKKFVCPVCGYVYEGEFIPEGFKCPVCGVDGSKFKVMEEGKLAAEHEYGIYAKTVSTRSMLTISPAAARASFLPATAVRRSVSIS